MTTDALLLSRLRHALQSACVTAYLRCQVHHCTLRGPSQTINSPQLKAQEACSADN